MPSSADVLVWLDRLYIAAEGAEPRDEDRKKAFEISALLSELGRATQRVGKQKDLVIVDAAAGKTYLGLLVGPLLLGPGGRPAHIIAIERDPQRVAQSRAAAGAARTMGVDIEIREGDVGDASLWPEAPAIVCALHACGPASDTVIDRAIASGAQHVLVVPCCTGSAVREMSVARRAADTIGIPRHSAVRRGFLESWIASERTLRLEAAGYETEVVALVPESVTPYNLLWRARRVGEPRRAERARRQRERLLEAAAVAEPSEGNP